MSMIVLLCAAATAVAGCSQVQGVAGAFEDASFKTPDFSLPDIGLRKSGSTDQNFDLGPKGPVAATDLISATGYCAPSTEPRPAPQAAAPAPQATQAAAAPPPDRLEPVGGSAAFQPQVIGGVTLGMSECAVARRIGTPSNVSISAGPEGQRRVVLAYHEGSRPGLYSFQSGRLIQMDATPQQAVAYDRQAKKRSQRTRAKPKREVQRMYVH